MSHFLTHLKKSFSLDLRSVALARALLALICIYDLLLKYQNLSLFIPDQFFPARYFNNPYTLFSIIDHPFFFKFLILAGIISSIFILIGKFTRIHLILLWIIFISFKNQLHIERKGFDILILIIFLWFALMPKDFGIKKLIKGAAPVFFNTTSVSWFFQIALIYGFAFLYKSDSPSWTKDFSALKYILQASYNSTMFSHLLFTHELVSTLLTIMTLALEMLAPLLILLVFRFEKCRMLTCLGFIFYHILILIFLDTGITSALSVCLWLSLLPPSFWASIKKSKDEIVCLEDKLTSKTNLMSGTLITIVLLTNIINYNLPTGKVFLPPLTSLAVSQSWEIFSNRYYSATNDMWLITESAGQDLLNERMITPDYFTKYYPPFVQDYYWRTLLGSVMFNFYKRKNTDMSEYLMDYLCRKNNVESKISLSMMIRNLDSEHLNKKLMFEYQCRPKGSTGSF